MSEVIINSFDRNNYNQLFPTGNSKTEISSITNDYFNLPERSNLTDILNWIGNYNLCWWRRRIPASSTYDLTKTEKTQSNANYSNPIIIYYSYSVDSQGNINYTKTQEKSYSRYDMVNELENDINSATGKTVIDINSGSTWIRKIIIKERQSPIIDWHSSSSNDYMRLYYYTMSYYTLSTTINTTPAGAWEYVQNKNSSFYPDSGISDNYEYEKLRIPFLNALFLNKTVDYI